MEIKNINLITLILIICLVFTVLLFGFLAFNLRPLARWANYQTICIEEESIDTNISWAVRKCNGRSKVYQVK